MSEQPHPTRSFHSAGVDTAESPDPATRPGSSVPWQAPAALGSYRLLERIGSGGMGYVYRAEDTRLGRVVALKVMRPELAARPELVERFLREGRAQASVEDAHVVPILAADEEEGLPFLVMPLLKGQTVADRLRLGAQPVAEALRIARGVAQGLAVAHAAGLVHRDIKPANIWLDERGGVRLMDFGLAQLASDLTHPGNVVGTPAFMPPEQARGDLVDERADLFSLGKVLHALLAGGVGKTLPPDLPPDLAGLCALLVHGDPAQRPPSAAWVAEELRRIGKRLKALPLLPFLAVALALALAAVFAFWR
ncbi:MAG: serine/threonine protein kinase [Gemmataceae bacterium]|nr:serine/threonine protein kinase [Gemmataceae bacterium]